MKKVLSSEPQWCAVKNCLNEREAMFKRGASGSIGCSTDKSDR